MSDIYNIAAWTTGTTYELHDIVLQNNLYYYALERHVASAAFSTDLAKWGGIITVNGQNKPYFIWKASYNYSLDIKPSVKTIRFEGYAQDIQDGISNIILPIVLQFNNRSLAEIKAILHFLDSRKGSERFYFIPPAPFNVQKLFVCQNWRPSQEFYENYSLECTFEERAV